MGYQFFLPMVLRWRASRAEAPLLEAEMYPTGSLRLKFIFSQKRILERM